MIQPFVRNKTEKWKSVPSFRSKTSVGRPAPCAAKQLNCTQRLDIIICDTLKVSVTRSCIRATWLLPESSFIWFVFRQSMFYSSALSPVRSSEDWPSEAEPSPNTEMNYSFSSIHWPASSVCWRLFHCWKCENKKKRKKKKKKINSHFAWSHFVYSFLAWTFSLAPIFDGAINNNNKHFHFALSRFV